MKKFLTHKQLKHLKSGSIYEIVWHDASTCNGWQSIQSARSDGACVCRTVGYYNGQNKAGDLLFAGTRDSRDSLNGVQSRPFKMIVSIHKLK